MSVALSPELRSMMHEVCYHQRRINRRFGWLMAFGVSIGLWWLVGYSTGWLA